MYNRLKQRYEDASLLRKILYTYLLCGFLPLMMIIGVFYKSSANMLLDQAYDNVGQNVATVGNGLDHSLQPYQILMEMLRNDKNLQIQLNMNYLNNNYVDLAHYVDNTLDDMMAMYPQLEGIHFYSNNATLPDDRYYFHLTGEMAPELRKRVEASTAPVVIARNTDSENSFLCVSKLNSLGLGLNRTFLEFQISDALLKDQLKLERSDNMFVLTDTEGNLLMDSDGKRRYETIQEFLPDWDSMEEGMVHTLKGANGRKYICMRSELENDIVLLMMVDRASILSSVRKIPLAMTNIFVLILVILGLYAYAQSSSIHNRLKKILFGINELGEGRFDNKIEPLGNDEFGVIATEVNRMGSQIDQLIQDNYQKQLIIKSTELNLLQEQINPHFLYNALAVISSLSIREHGKETVQSIRYLADFYRISLNKGRKIITVKEEIDLLNNYMRIQLLRFSDYVEIAYELQPGVEKYYTIKLLLQPLVENAIHHAREEEMFLSIVVKAYEHGDRVIFDVVDNGMGIEPEKLKRLQEQLLRQEEGFGLKNVDKRIKLAYGQEYGVSIYSTAGVGTRIHLEIPKKENRENGGVS